MLYHWQREEDVGKDYEYAQFNKKINVVEFSVIEYEENLIDLDVSWSKEETYYFWDLCKLYDLRFIVIHDRYEPSYNRSIEDLKNRYYTISRRILEVNIYWLFIDHLFIDKKTSWSSNTQERIFIRTRNEAPSLSGTQFV